MCPLPSTTQIVLKIKRVLTAKRCNSVILGIISDGKIGTIDFFLHYNVIALMKTINIALFKAFNVHKFLLFHKNNHQTNLVLFGEWLVPHTIVYPQDKYQDAYFYDVYDLEAKRYLKQDEVKNIIECLGVNYVPVFYEGEFQSWEHIQQFVGRTDLGGEHGEGVVVKNMSRINDPNTRLPFYTKIVGEKFSEKKSVKPKVIDPEKMAERERLQTLVESVVTEGRVTKLVHKMVDEGVIPEKWDEHDMATIARNIGKAVYYDCVKEEPDVVEQVGEHFGKLANGTAMRIVRGMLAQPVF